MNRIWSLGTIVIVALIAASSVGLARQWRETQALRLRIETLQRDALELGRLRAVNEQLRAAQVSDADVTVLRADQAALPRLRAEIEEMKSRLAKPAPTEPVGAAGGSPSRGSSAGTAKGAQVQRVSGSAPPRPSLEDLRATVDRRYAALFNELALAAVEGERLRRLLVERVRAETDAAFGAMEQGNDPNSLAVRQQVALGQFWIETSIRLQLGQAVHAAYEEFEWKQSARNLVVQLGRLLEQNITPLTEPQKKAMVEILARARPADGNPAPGTRGNVAPRFRLPLTEETEQAAARVLTAEQLRVFKHWRERLPEVTR